MGLLGHALGSDGPYFETLGQLPGPHINLKACLKKTGFLMIRPHIGRILYVILEYLKSCIVLSNC